MESETFTRRQLYELVWKEPAQTIAPRFGLSDRGFAKLCERHAIPTPPRGYWAKKEAGQRVVRPPLIELNLHSDGDGPPALRLPAQRKDGKADEPDTLLAFWTSQRDEIGRIAVPKRLANPHKIIARWIVDDATAKSIRTVPARMRQLSADAAAS